MAEITRNSKNNELEIFKGFHKSKFVSEMKTEPIGKSDIDLLKDKRKIAGIRFNNFFEKNEIAGYYAENEMKKILEKKQYGSLYTGNFLQISEKTGGFYLNIGNTRPDFLVKLPNVGKIFIDVKCRNLYEIKNNDDETILEYFSLNKEEINALSDIQKAVDIPVWIAVKNYNEFNDKKNNFKNNFFFVAPINKIKIFIKKINNKAGKISGLFYSYKIPVSVFTRTNNFAVLDFSENFDKELINKVAEISVKTIDEIKEIILEMIGKEDVFKTYLPYILSGHYSKKGKKSSFSGKLSHLSPQDINSVLWKMITDKLIDYNKGKPLKIK